MKENKIYILALILFVGVFFILTIKDGHYWGGDFSQYVHHAKNISEGKDYSDIGYIQNPHYPIFIGPTTYPPVFPMILSPVIYLFGLNSTAMKIELILFFLATLYLIYSLFNKKLTYISVILLVAVIALNPYFWKYKDYLHLDFMFIFFIYLSLKLISGIPSPNPGLKINKIMSILLGLSIYFAAGIKGLGMTLIVSLFIFDLLKYRKITSSSLYTFITFFILMTVQYIFIHNDFEYLNKFALNPITWISNLIGYLKLNLHFWDNGWIKFPRYVLSIFFYIFVIVGYISRAKENFSILEVFLPVFVIALSIYQFFYSQFLMAILPILVYYAFSGFSFIFNQIARTQKKYIAAGLMLIVFSGYIINYTFQDYGPVDEGVETSNAKLLFEEIKKNSDENDVFIFWKPRVLSLYTNRQASIYHEAEDKDLFSYLNSISADFIVAGPMSNTIIENRPFDIQFINFLDDFIKRNPHKFELIYKNEELKLFRYLPS